MGFLLQILAGGFLGSILVATIMCFSYGTVTFNGVYSIGNLLFLPCTFISYLFLRYFRNRRK
jgi:hypothetical protein